MSEAYRVGVAIALSANTQLFGTLAQHFLGLNQHLTNFQNNWKRTMGIVGGGLGVFAGSAMLSGVKKLVDHGNDLVKIQRDMAQAGVSATQVQEAYAKAWQLTGKYQNMSAVEVMKMQNDARMTFGDQGMATEHIQPFVEMASFLKSYQGGKHSGKDEGLMREINAAMKSGELAGKIDPADMIENAKQLTAMKVAYGDQLKIQTYLAAQRTAGVALRNAGDDFRYGMFPALVQEQGASAGVMLMTAFNKVVAGTGNRTKSLEHMKELGLLNGDQIEYGKDGHAKGLKNADAIKNNRDAAVNFGDWVMKTFKPLIDAKTRDPIKESQMISSMFPDRNAAKAITEIIQQYRKLAKDAEQMKAARQAMDEDGYNAGSWDYQKQAFETQWTNLMNALGAPIVKTATGYLADLNQSIAGMSKWAAAKENTETIKNIVTGIGALGAFFVAGGATAILAALGPAGWLVGGLAALAVVVAKTGLLGRLMAPRDMATNAERNKNEGSGKGVITESANRGTEQQADTLVAGFEKIKAAMLGFNPWLDSVAAGVANWFKSTAAAVVAGVKSEAAAAIASVGSAFAGLGAAITAALKAAVSGAAGGLGISPGGSYTSPGKTGAPAVQKQSYNAVPPSSNGNGGGGSVIVMDGEAVGRLTTRRMARNMSGPTQGAAWSDSTRSYPSNDTYSLTA